MNRMNLRFVFVNIQIGIARVTNIFAKAVSSVSGFTVIMLPRLPWVICIAANPPAWATPWGSMGLEL